MMESAMKLLSLRALSVGSYALILGTYGWHEHEPALAAVGLLPVLLFTLVRAFNDRLEGSDWSWATRRAKRIDR